MLNNIRNCLLGALIALVLQGCAGTGGMVPSTTAPTRLNPDDATIVFMRPSLFGAAISASVFDVTKDQTKFIGIIQSGTKVGYNVPPGKYTFMVIGESADFMMVDILPKKNYYALVTPRMGVWKARFSFRPIRLNEFSTADFADWDSSTKWVQSSPEAESWAASNATDIQSKRMEYWPQWQSKDQVQRDSQTLKSEDGR